MRKRCGILVLAGAAILGLASPGHTGGEKNAFFDGKSLRGWEGLPDLWSVKDGAIVGSSATGLKFNTFLCTTASYKDFELKFQVKLTGKGWTGNSGVQIRSELKDKEKFVVWGPQCDMGAQYWGSLYGERFGGKKPGDGTMLKASDPKLVKKVLKENDFNHYEIKVVGKHVTIKLNGETTVDDDFANLPDEGIIALQMHAGNAMEVEFRHIQFTDLSKK